MRFNNNLLLIASFFGAATPFRRTCRPATANDGKGFYTMTDIDTWDNIAADFCVSLVDLQKMNPDGPGNVGDIFTVPCKDRERDCARIPDSTYGYYTIVDGDNWASIASDFCANVDDLRSLNPQTIVNETATAGVVVQVLCDWN
ncbi:uncharacterized protein L3040_008636 [Drepanopeziza brunnea f. sp. 'multigermtubi']|uniref:LysM domain-containing protein n=1 Tax=Marssonina brunnea f. sp. multigermtubi (strain MB_m1) TaxID=1072389 RepID=K1WME1_MARBU|nr:uncharacterized protein MBM_08215 [Drepanopeziza brunnea f. sp. 'multigermtubi' MB_m1]EKD13497.1 hypothetical protein MBM_08215 [Drepanopeziza brunnea f. sp. 'multigermtubi' MB_m1]KAJ5033521.1 hypothetical protein L3040_008636 [Drepanopeziza brunnea f. sp. 'multigermtubi']